MCEYVDRLVQKGMAQGQEKLAKLIAVLMSEKEYDKINEITQNVQAIENYYRQYGIS